MDRVGPRMLHLAVAPHHRKVHRLISNSDSDRAADFCQEIEA
jgi:hypothetical protein